MKTKMIVLFALLLVCGCVKENMSALPEDITYSNVKINIALNQYTDVKSSISTDENYIEKMAVWVYDEQTGLLEASKMFSGTSVERGEMNMSVRHLSSCSFFFLANCDGVDAPAKISGAREYPYFLDRYTGLGRSFPMSAVMEHVDVSSDTSLDVFLDRLVAKYNFRLDRSQLKGTFELISVSVEQAAVDITPFKRSKANLVAQGDYASDPDIKDIMMGKAAPFYLLENCRGELSEGNVNPWKKIPSDKSEAEHSTYLEVHARYVSPTLTSEDLTYRMFLGKNNLTNYDICRNGVYTVTLVLSDIGITQGILNSLWKMDPGDYKLTGNLKFAKKNARCAACFQAPFIKRSDGSRTVEIYDTIPILRSSPKLTYSLAYNVGDFIRSGLNVSDDSGQIIVKPYLGKTPEGEFDLAVYSYDSLLSDSVKIYCGIMDLNIRFDHKSGKVIAWSSNGNPAGVTFKILMEYKVYASAQSGSNIFDIKTVYAEDAGDVECLVTPSETPVTFDRGELCSAIRNISGKLAPNPNGPQLYMPYRLDLNFNLSSAYPEDAVGRTLVRFNSEIFSLPSAGYVHNSNYGSLWYLEHTGAGNVTFYRNILTETYSSGIAVSESCNGEIFNSAPNNYSSAVFEI